MAIVIFGASLLLWVLPEGSNMIKESGASEDKREVKTIENVYQTKQF